MQASPSQRLVVAGTFALLAAGLARVAALLAAAGTAPIMALPACLLVAVLGAEFADIGTGVYHWAMDNYGNASTPVFGSQIEAFQGHHEEPWTITYRDFCNNCYPTCIATMPFLAAFVGFVSQPYVLLWGLVACTGISFCQEIHKWSHTLHSQCNPVVNWLQERGLLLARKIHLRHHRPPFETNYCIVTGHFNPILDRIGFFRRLESLTARWTGVQARCETGVRFDHLVAKRGVSVAAR